MSLKETINEDMKNAMRSKDTALLGTIRLLQAAIKQKEVDERIDLDDSTIIPIIEKMLKQRNDSIDAFKKAERADLVLKEEFEFVGLKAEMALSAINELSPSYKAVFNLYVIEEYTHKEIAEILGISQGTSKSNLSKAKFNLQKVLKEKFTNIV